MESPDIPDLLSCIPGQDHTPAPVRDGISSYAKSHFIMPGSKGLNPHKLAYKWMKGLGPWHHIISL